MTDNVSSSSFVVVVLICVLKKSPFLRFGAFFLDRGTMFTWLVSRRLGPSSSVEVLPGSPGIDQVVNLFGLCSILDLSAHIGRAITKHGARIAGYNHAGNACSTCDARTARRRRHPL
jgi:hypothetical protein